MEYRTFDSVVVGRIYNKILTVIVKRFHRCHQRQWRPLLQMQGPSMTLCLSVISFRMSGGVSTASLNDAVRELANSTSGFVKWRLSTTPGTCCWRGLTKLPHHWQRPNRSALLRSLKRSAARSRFTKTFREVLDQSSLVSLSAVFLSRISFNISILNVN